MNGLRYVVGLCLVFLAVVIGLQSAGNREKGDDLIKTTDVVEAFQRDGVKIALAQDLSPGDFYIDNKMPAIYEFPGSGEKLFIYEFPNINVLNQALNRVNAQGSLENNAGFKQLQAQQESLINSIQAKNLLLIYVIQYDSKIVSQIQDVASLDKFTRLFAPNLETLKKITFADLNNGKTVHFQGGDQMWEGKVVLEYYQLAWIDENGQANKENWTNEDFQLKYLGGEPAPSKQIICNYKGPAGEGQGVFEYADLTVNKDGYLNLGSARGNSEVDLSGPYTMTVRWENKSDTFVMANID